MVHSGVAAAAVAVAHGAAGFSPTAEINRRPRCNAGPSGQQYSAPQAMGFSGLRAIRGLGSEELKTVNSRFHTTAAAQIEKGQRQGSRQVTRMMPIGVPRMPYKTPGEAGQQWVDLWNIFYRERVVFVGQEINEEFSNTLVATLLYLDSVNNKPLTFYINCDGGEVHATLAIYDTMQHIKSPVNTIAFGHAYSMGAFLLAAGTKGKRGVFPHTTVMLHAPSGTANGQAADIINETKELLRLQEYLMDKMSEMTEQPLDKLKRDLAEKGNMYLTPEQAIEYGAIDLIVKPRKDKGGIPM